jgi:hypothetical protein
MLSLRRRWRDRAVKAGIAVAVLGNAADEDLRAHAHRRNK